MMLLSGQHGKEVSYEHSVWREQRLSILLAVIVASGHERHFHRPVSFVADGSGAPGPVCEALDAGVCDLRFAADGAGRIGEPEGSLRPRPAGGRVAVPPSQTAGPDLPGVYHPGTGLPWAWQIGAGTESEQVHLRHLARWLPAEALLVAGVECGRIVAWGPRGDASGRPVRSWRSGAVPAKGRERQLGANGIEVGPELAAQEEGPPAGCAEAPRGHGEGKTRRPKDL
jgi:hypothetical protein